LSDPCIEAQKCTETHKETVSIASETIGSSNSSGKTSPIDLPGKATSPERETPTKSKKRKRKSRDRYNLAIYLNYFFYLSQIFCFQLIIF